MLRRPSNADCKLLQVGKEDCFAVFDAVGVVHDPVVAELPV